MQASNDADTARWWALAAAAVALAGALAIHAPTLGAYFLEDDVQWVLGGWSWSWSHFFSIQGRDHFYRPVIELYFAIQTRLWGASPGAFHLANVLLHALNGLLVFALGLRLFGRALPAWVTASLFVLHPRTVEMVAWISGVTGLLMTTFIVVTLLLHLRFQRTRRYLWQVLAILACGAALLAHEAAVVLAALLPLVVWLWETSTPAAEPKRRPAARLAWDMLPYALLMAAFAWVSHAVNQHNYVVTEGHYRPGWHAVGNLAHYLASLYVGRQEPLSLVLTGLTLVAIAVATRGVLRCGALWIVVALLPYSLFLWANTNRYLYLPAIGFCLIVAELLLRLANLRVAGRRVGVALAIALGLTLSWRSALFGHRTAGDMALRAESYREYVADFRAAHPRLDRGAIVAAPEPGPNGPQRLYVEPLLRVAYADPTLQVRLRGADEGAPATAVPRDGAR